MKKKTNLVQSVDRALSILEILENSSELLGVTEISNRLSLHKSTLFGLLTTLENKGFVFQDSQTGKYGLGLRVLELGQKVIARMDLRNQARPFLKKIMETYGETVHLVIRDNEEVVYIDKVEGPQTIGPISQIGKRNPVHCTGVGKCLLAFLTDEEQDILLSKIQLKCYTQNTITNHEVLKEHFALIRRQGYSIDNEEIEIGLRCVAAPIFDYNGTIIGAISIAGPSARLTDQRIQELIKPVKECALAISQNLGYKG
ncbi:MAG: IclR family transcriptional regulator [Dehalobacterium sp.]